MPSTGNGVPVKTNNEYPLGSWENPITLVKRKDRPTKREREAHKAPYQLGSWQNPAPSKIRIKKPPSSPPLDSTPSADCESSKDRRLASPVSRFAGSSAKATPPLDSTTSSLAESDIPPTTSSVADIPPLDLAFALNINEFPLIPAASDRPEEAQLSPGCGEVSDCLRALSNEDIDWDVLEPLEIGSPVRAVSALGEEAVEDVRIGVADFVITRNPSPVSVAEHSIQSGVAHLLEELADSTEGVLPSTQLQGHLAQQIEPLASDLTVAPKNETLERQPMSAEESQLIQKAYHADRSHDRDTIAIPPSSWRPSPADESLRTVPSALDQPPPERRGKALRDINRSFVGTYNKIAVTATRNPALHRAIFESYMAQTELDSGEIKVINDVDAEGAPPNVEFEYSNEILYHEGVPDPELGLGCDCEGPCNPLSTTCSCVKRQKLYSYSFEDYTGFVYDA